MSPFLCQNKQPASAGCEVWVGQYEYIDKCHTLVYYNAMSELGWKSWLSLETGSNSHTHTIHRFHKAVRTANEQQEGWIRDRDPHRSAINRRTLVRRRSGVLIVGETISPVGDDSYAYRAVSSRTPRIEIGMAPERSHVDLFHRIAVGGVALSEFHAEKNRIADTREVSAVVSNTTVTTNMRGRSITTQDADQVRAIQMTLQEMIFDGTTHTADPADIFEALQLDPVGFRQEVDSLKDLHISASL
jgi:hypothetical protein